MTTSVEDRISLDDRVSRLEGAYEHLATKSDLSELKAELKADIGELKAEFKGDIGELKAEFKGDIGELKAEFKDDIGKLQVALIKWMVGLVLGGMLGITGLVIAVMRLIG